MVSSEATVASELFFFATIDTFDGIVREFLDCCDCSTEDELKLTVTTARLSQNLLNPWKNYPGPYKWNYCPSDISDEMLMELEIGTYLAMKMKLDGSNPQERALIAKLNQMENDFGKAMDAQEKKQSANRTSSSSSSSTSSGGCYIATCVYGSYDRPEVWVLRRFRDQFLAENPFGRAFIRMYYAVSPRLVDRFGNSTCLKSRIKPYLDKLVSACLKRGYSCLPYQD